MSNFEVFLSTPWIPFLGFFLLLFSILIGLLDYIHGKIPNKLIFIIIFIWILWNILISINGSFDISLKNITEIIFIIVICYFLYINMKIGGWDIKLILAYSLFFICSWAPLIFVGNTATITVISLLFYVVVHTFLVDRWGSIDSKFTMRKLIPWIWSTLHWGQIIKKKSYITLFLQYLLILSTIYSLLFTLEGSWVGTLPISNLLFSSTGKMELTIVLFFLIRHFIRKKQDWIWSVFIIEIFLLFWFYQNELLSHMVQTIWFSIFHTLKIMILWIIIVYSYEKLLKNVPRKQIALEKVRLGNTINIPETRELWIRSYGLGEVKCDILLQKMLMWNKKNLPLEAHSVKIINQSMWKRIANMRHTDLIYCKNVCLEQTIPYGIYIIFWFFLSILSDINLSNIFLEIILSP